MVLSACRRAYQWLDAVGAATARLLCHVFSAIAPAARERVTDAVTERRVGDAPYGDCGTDRRQ